MTRMSKPWRNGWGWQDTQLPMTEVAAAAGFGSIRRFNEIFQQLYQRPPNALRRTGVTEESAVTTGAVAIRLGYRPPYEWDSIVSFLHARAISGVEKVSSERYTRTIAIGDERGVLIVEPADRNCLRAIVRFPNLRSLPAIIARSAASSILLRILWPWARISARTLCWRPSFPLAPVSGFPALGTDLNSPSAPFFGSRSR